MHSPAPPRAIRAVSLAGMEVPDSEELSALMPNLRQAAQRASSPGETAQLREYMQARRVAGSRPCSRAGQPARNNKPTCPGSSS